ncbi:MAG: hypothetical protein JNK04_17160 [Myxococcales bacterium]|nr:hypothetical protein [Myxococcales bacterium]
MSLQRALAVGALTLFAIAFGCGSGPTPVTPEAGAILDTTDRCMLLTARCPGAKDDDGCPDMEIPLAQGCTSDRTQADLAEVAGELAREARYTRVLVRGDPYFAECIVAAMRSRGIAEERLEVMNDKTQSVRFEVASWAGAVCP